MIMVFYDSHAEIYTSQATKGAIINVMFIRRVLQMFVKNSEVEKTGHGRRRLIFLKRQYSC
jgi:hypothetical protein